MTSTGQLKNNIGDLRLNYDVAKLWALIGAAFVCVYFLPFSISYLFFIFLIGTMVTSKRYDYFWIAFWFIILDCPGDLFQSGGTGDLKQLPFIVVGSKGVVGLRQLIPLVFFARSLVSYKKAKTLALRTDFKFLFILFMFYALLGYILGMGLNSILNTILVFILWTFLISLPRLLSEKEIEYMDRLLFSAVILAFVSQLTTLATGERWIDVFKETDYYLKETLLIQEGVVSRTISSPYIILYSFIKALYYILSKKSNFSKGLLSLIIVISAFSIFLSATRGWILASVSVFLLILITFSNAAVLKRVVALGIAGGVLLFIVTIVFPPIKSQMTNAYERFKTVEQIAQGDLTMDGSLLRVTGRAPKVLKPFSEMPILGWGFADVYWAKKDGHVGHLTMMLNCGVVGYAILIFFFFKWFFQLYSMPNNNISIKSAYGPAPKILSYGLVFIFIIHSTSFQFWGFDLEIGPVIVISLILSSYNSIIAQILE
jgi:hypothetical protein